jgi:two-component system, response regulator
MQPSEIIDILLVEDNQDDVEITRKALKQARLFNRLHVVHDGREACDFLFRTGAYADPVSAPRPGLVLLDINMPRMNGLEVLKRLKADPELRRVPVIMLTVSRRDEDIIKSYEVGCNSFIQKPVDFDKFVEVVKQLSLYWGLLNVPSPSGPPAAS